MKRFAVTIKGLPPGLLMHRFTQEPKPKTMTKKEEAERLAYRCEDGRLGLPARHIVHALAQAGRNFTNARAVKQNILIEPEMVPFHNGTEYQIRTEKFRRPGFTRHRPWLKEWEMSFTLTTKGEEAVPTDTIRYVLEEAGKMIGVGEQRRGGPKMPGQFGAFEVTAFEAISGTVGSVSPG